MSKQDFCQSRSCLSLSALLELHLFSSRVTSPPSYSYPTKFLVHRSLSFTHIRVNVVSDTFPVSIVDTAYEHRSSFSIWVSTFLMHAYFNSVNQRRSDVRHLEVSSAQQCYHYRVLRNFGMLDSGWTWSRVTNMIKSIIRSNTGSSRWPEATLVDSVVLSAVVLSLPEVTLLDQCVFFPGARYWNGSAYRTWFPLS